MKRITNLVLIGLACMTMMACSKKGGSSAVATAPAATATYTQSNGKCYDSNNTEVDFNTYCGSTTSNGYYYNNGYCCDKNNNDNRVDNRYCTGNSGQACSGLHIYIDYFGKLWKVTCDGQSRTGNCSGYDLIQGSTGNWVYCN